MSERRTINEVAEAANVSIATVSRVFNNLGNVKESTRERVYSAARELGYKLPGDNASRDMDKDGCKIILAIVTNIGQPFMTQLIDGITTILDSAGYECVIHQHKTVKNSYEDLKPIADAAGASGLILTIPGITKETLTRLNEDYPLVQCAEITEHSGLPYVSVDDYTAGKTAVSYLIKTGHRRIALINGPTSFKYARCRQEGYLDALKEAGIEPERQLIANFAGGTPESAIAAISEIIHLKNPPDAVFAVSDDIGASVIKTAVQAKLSVPEDLAVIGFGNDFISRVCQPSLTTISQPVAQMGELAAEMLMNRINDVHLSHQQVELKADLVIRESV